MSTKIGFCLLGHTHIHRIQQLVEYLSTHGAKVAIHIDRKMSSQSFKRLCRALAGNPNVVFVDERISCSWGTWSLVEAQINTARLLLETFPEVDYIYQVSGTCLPVQPMHALETFLTRQESPTDFIETVALETFRWVKDGLSEERLAFYHPFNWRTQRRLFEWSLQFQRMLRLRRIAPRDLNPSFGSQWWCLSRPTLEKTLNDPNLPRYIRFFRHSWIPDESFFQTLARKHSTRLRSVNLTFSRFDHQGKPVIFYDDHLESLMQSDAFFVRKVWVGADRLYQYFLHEQPEKPRNIRPNEPLQNRIYKAEHRRTDGRAGLVSAARYTLSGHAIESARPYHIYVGFSDLIANMPQLIEKHKKQRGHKRLFSPSAVELAPESLKKEALSLATQPVQRDYAPVQYLMQLIWHSKEMPVSFQARIDDLRMISAAVLNDPNCHIYLLEGGWALAPLKEEGRKTLGLAPPELGARRMFEERQLINHDFSGSQAGARIQRFAIGDVVREPEKFAYTLFGAHTGVRLKPNWNNILERLTFMEDRGVNLGSAIDAFRLNTARMALYPELALLPDVA